MEVEAEAEMEVEGLLMLMLSLLMLLKMTTSTSADEEAPLRPAVPLEPPLRSPPPSTEGTRRCIQGATKEEMEKEKERSRSKASPRRGCSTTTATTTTRRRRGPRGPRRPPATKGERRGTPTKMPAEAGEGGASVGQGKRGRR